MIRGRGFKATTKLACKFGTDWGASAKFINETAIECLPSALPVAVGTTIKLAVSLNGQGLASLAGLSPEPLSLLVADTPVPSELDPALVTVGETDVRIVVWATGLADTASLSCRVAGLLPGSPLSSIFIAEYAEDAVSGAASAICTIPSAQFLQAAAGLAAPAPGSLSIELSNDGSVFSTAGLEVHFLPTDQVRGISPANGPETGATVIDVTLDALPVVNSAFPKAACEFPGGEEVTAVFISPTLIQCTAPPLVPGAQGVGTASAQGSQRRNEAGISWAPVTVSQGGRRIGHFVFAYTRGVKVLATEPPDTVPPEGANPAALTLLVIGSGFLPTRVTGLRCRLQEGLTELGAPALEAVD